MFRYTVSKEDFTEMSVYLMKQKSARLSSRIKLVLFTVVQMAVIGWLIFQKNDASTLVRVLLGIASVVWAFQTVFSFGFYKVRAKMMLSNQQDKDPDGDFWKEHRLQLKNDKLDISYGATKASVECAQITGTDKTEHLTLLMSGKSIFEIVPESVTKRSGWEPFLEEIRETAARRLKEAQEKQRRETLEKAIFKEYLQIPEEEMIARQVRMKRLSFLTPAGWSRVTLLVLLMPLAVLGISIYFGEPLYIILAAALLLLTNAGTLMIFTPLYKNVVRKRLQPAGEEGYLLAVADSKIHWFTRVYHFRYPISSLRAVIDKPEATYYYFPDQEMLFVPASCREEFKKAVSHRRSLQERSQVDTGETDDTEE